MEIKRVQFLDGSFISFNSDEFSHFIENTGSEVIQVFLKSGYSFRCLRKEFSKHPIQNINDGVDVKREFKKIWHTTK